MIEININGHKATVSATRLTDMKEVDIASSETVGKNVKTSWLGMLHSEHSPIRVIQWRIELKEIPTFVNGHLVRHKVGVEPFIKSLREDRCGKGDENRWSPQNGTFYMNPQSLMTMARRRLCTCASAETRLIMKAIVDAVAETDIELASQMVPMCIYRNGICHEFKSCGISPHYKKVQEIDWLDKFNDRIPVKYKKKGE